MNSDIIKLRKQYQEAKETRSALVTSGGAKDYAEYKLMVGQITGLTLAITAINDLLEQKAKQNGDNN